MNALSLVSLGKLSQITIRHLVGYNLQLNQDDITLDLTSKEKSLKLNQSSNSLSLDKSEKECNLNISKIKLNLDIGE